MILNSLQSFSHLSTFTWNIYLSKIWLFNILFEQIFCKFVIKGISISSVYAKPVSLIIISEILDEIRFEGSFHPFDIDHCRWKTNTGRVFFWKPHSCQVSSKSAIPTPVCSLVSVINPFLQSNRRFTFTEKSDRSSGCQTLDVEAPRASRPSRDLDVSLHQAPRAAWICMQIPFCVQRLSGNRSANRHGWHRYFLNL